MERYLTFNIGHNGVHMVSSELIGLVLEISQNLYFFEEYFMEHKYSSGNLKTVY